jgi:hypothetical protein
MGRKRRHPTPSPQGTTGACGKADGYIRNSRAMDVRREGSPLPSWISLTLGGIFLIVSALVVLGVLQVSRTGVIRCYKLEQPLTPGERVILAGQPITCLSRQCRATLRLTSKRGLACFFPRVWLQSGLLRQGLVNARAGSEVKWNASQRSFDRWGYRTG